LLFWKYNGSGGEYFFKISLKSQKFRLWLIMNFFLLWGTEHSRAQINFWEDTKGPPGNNITALATNSSDHLFAATFDRGAFRSTDQGSRWTPINAGLNTSSFINSFAINTNRHLVASSYTVLAVDSRGYVFAGTLGGIFRSIQTTTAVQERAGDIPTAFSLEQNYPNPFSPHGRETPTRLAFSNPSTTLRFNFSRPAQATLAIYNTLGQKVRSWRSQRFEAGQHQVVWDGCDASGKPVPSGVYLLRLSGSMQDSHVALGQTKKIVVLE
jgi:hypothetical protein